MTEKPTHHRTLGRFIGIRHDDAENRRVIGLESTKDEKGRSKATWTIIHNGLRSYNRTFKPVLGDRNLMQLLSEKTQSNDSSTVLDIMASEIFVIEVVEKGFASGVAVSLGYPHDPFWDAQHGKGVVNTVNGDITQTETWRQIERKKREIAPNGFDIIISRPEGGLQSKYLGDNPILLYLMLQKMWRLGSDDSTLLFQVPRRFVTEFEDYVEILQENGIEVQFPNRLKRIAIRAAGHPDNGGSKYGIPVRIQKQPNSPTWLPKPVHNT